MAFPHPKSRKENDRNSHIPNNRGVVWKFFKRMINVTDYRNPEDDVNPAKDRTFHVGCSFGYKVGWRESRIICCAWQNTSRPMGALRRMRQQQPDSALPTPVPHQGLARR
jgi:hypothetical protein